MDKVPKKDLKNLFISQVQKDGGFCSEGNPFILNIYGLNFFVFIKNISPAYYVNYPDITRIQLPKSDRFKEVVNSDLEFIILGYDVENDIFVSWNPSKIKDRLNSKQNVSLYSRHSLQKGTLSRGFKTGTLSNGDKIVLFKREDLNNYFTKINELFKLENITKQNNFSKDVNFNEEIFDFEEIKKIIEPLLLENKVLEAVNVLQEKFKDNPEIKDMTFKQLFDLVKKYYVSMF